MSTTCSDNYSQPEIFRDRATPFHIHNSPACLTSTRLRQHENDKHTSLKPIPTDSDTPVLRYQTRTQTVMYRQEPISPHKADFGGLLIQ